MNKRRKVVIVILAFLATLVLVTIIPMFVNPIRRPNRILQAYILRITPLGTSIEDVVAIVEGYADWTLGSVNFERGFTTLPPNILVIGEMHVGSFLGSYHAWHVMLGVPNINVSAQWGFDEDGRLTDVNIRKQWSP